MTVEYFLDADGRPIFVEGYCATWNTVSHPVPELGNRCSLFLPGAFRDVLKRPMLSLTCQVNHAGPGAVLGTVRDSNLEVWEDAYGLAFRCGPLSRTFSNSSIIRSIVEGRTRGASTRDEVGEDEIRTIDGQEIVVVRRVKSLLHLGPVDVPMDDATAVWSTHEVPYDLPGYLQPIARTWAESRPGAGPPKGFSEREWADFGSREAGGRRLHSEAKARQYARQRERNRAGREARAT